MKSKSSLVERWKKKLFRRNRGSILLRLKFTLVNLYANLFDRKNKKRLKGGRYALLQHMPKNCSGVEVGVWKGDFSAALAHFLSPVNLTLVDPWIVSDSEKIVFPRTRSGETIGVGDEIIENQSNADKVFEYVKNRFADNSTIRVMRSSSLQAADSFDQNSIDWAYIDGSHYYDDVKDDLEAWLPKIRRGGILFGDDYYWRTPDGEYSVKKACDEFINKHGFARWIVYRGQFLIHIA